MAGYGAQHAAELAIRHDVDLHVAVGLISRGCDPELARAHPAVEPGRL